jgi:uncharacterized iron-regulated membrane protein
MRQWHRRLSIFVAAFMFFIAFTGALLQVESMFGHDDAPGPAPTAGAAGPPPPAGVTDDRAQALLATALAGVHRNSGGAILSIELRFDAVPTAEAIVADPQMRRLRIDARTGEPLDGASRRGGRDLHGVLLDLHRGAFAGSTGLWISLLCGVALVVLSVTGLTIYLQAWLRRRANRQGALLW